MDIQTTQSDQNGVSSKDVAKIAELDNGNKRSEERIVL